MIEEKQAGGQAGSGITKLEMLLFIVILTLIALSSVMVLRLMNDKPVFPAGESYYNLRMGGSLAEDRGLSSDPLQGQQYSANAFHFLIAGLLSISSADNVAIFLPIILGVLSSILFFVLLTRLGFSDRNAVFSMLILLFTPAFIVIFSSLQTLGFAIFLSLLAMVLIVDDKHRWLMIPGILCLGVLALTSLAAFAITLALTVTLAYLENSSPKRIALLIAGPSALFLALGIAIGWRTMSFSALGFHTLDLKNSLSILGATLGLDIFLVFLFLTGFIVIWSKHPENRLTHLLSLLLAALSFVNSPALAFSSIIMAVYCVVAINYFVHRKWELEVIRTGTMLLIICALVFSSVSQISALVNSQPDRSLRDAFLSIRSDDQTIVYTDQRYGFIAEFYSMKRSLLDDNSYARSDNAELTSAYSALFNSSRIKDAEPVLKQYNISFIVISPQMKEELLEGREERILFVVRHSDSFVKRFDENGVEVWEYRQE
jgi:hypothetical protein